MTEECPRLKETKKTITCNVIFDWSSDRRGKKGYKAHYWDN